MPALCSRIPPLCRGSDSPEFRNNIVHAFPTSCKHRPLKPSASALHTSRKPGPGSRRAGSTGRRRSHRGIPKHHILSATYSPHPHHRNKTYRTNKTSLVPIHPQRLDYDIGDWLPTPPTLTAGSVGMAPDAPRIPLPPPQTACAHQTGPRTARRRNGQRATPRRRPRSLRPRWASCRTYSGGRSARGSRGGSRSAGYHHLPHRGLRGT